LDLTAERKYEIGAYILLILTAIIWAGTWPLGRWLVSEEVGGETIPPMIIATLRYLVVIVPFLLLLRWREGTLNLGFMRENWKFFSIMGLLSVTIYQAGYLIGEYYTSSSDAVVIVSSHPTLVIILASVIFKIESINWKMLIGILFSFTGILLIFGFSPNVNVPNRILGNLLIFLGAISYATYIVLSRQFLNKYESTSQPSSLYIITWVSCFGLVTTIPTSLVINPEYLNLHLFFQVPERVWLGIAYLSFISTILGYWFYLEGVKRLSASRAAIFQNLVPIIGVAMSAVFLNEIIDPLIHTSAILLIIVGISIVNRTS
jgi:drug/metabolite transporter (DMT)-like permease